MQAQQLDTILANISAAIALLKQSEEQPGAQHRPGSTAYTSRNTSAVHRTSSTGRDAELGLAGPAAHLGGNNALLLRADAWPIVAV